MQRDLRWVMLASRLNAAHAPLAAAMPAAAAEAARRSKLDSLEPWDLPAMHGLSATYTQVGTFVVAGAVHFHGAARPVAAMPVHMYLTRVLFVPPGAQKAALHRCVSMFISPVLPYVPEADSPPLPMVRRWHGSSATTETPQCRAACSRHRIFRPPPA